MNANDHQNLTAAPLQSMVEPLLQWYADAKRALPWREDPTPYHVWLSEVMLQQTRIEAVIPYYLRFLEACPSVAELAAIHDDALMKLWQGLGYYSRARNLKKAACVLMEQHGGTFPADYAALRALPGIGDYTAGAIASIAFGLPEPAVDGNVLRVIMRLTGDPSDIMAQSVKQRVAMQLREIYPRQKARAAAFTQAIMELGQQVCIPNGEPHCDRCPLGLFCTARAQSLTDSIPYRSPKKPRRIEQRTVMIPIRTTQSADGQETLLYGLHRRPPQGLLSGLWEFPNTDGHLPSHDVKNALQSLYHGLGVLSVSDAPSAVHIFTHIEWHMIGYCCNCEQLSKDEDLVWATAEQLRTTYAVPSAYRAYLDYLLKQNQ